MDSKWRLNCRSNCLSIELGSTLNWTPIETLLKLNSKTLQKNIIVHIAQYSSSIEQFNYLVNSDLLIGEIDDYFHTNACEVIPTLLLSTMSNFH